MLQKRIKRILACLLAILLMVQVVYTDGKIIAIAETPNAKITENSKESGTSELEVPEKAMDSYSFKVVEAAEAVEAEKKPIAGASIVVKDSGAQPVGETLTTSEEGIAEFQVAAGTDISGYTYSVTEKNHVDISEQLMSGVSSGGEIEVSMTIRYKYTISGVVKEAVQQEDGSTLLQPVEGAAVSIQTNPSGAQGEAVEMTTEQDGAYALEVTYAKEQTSMTWKVEKPGYEVAEGILQKGDETLDTTEDADSSSQYTKLNPFPKKTLKVVTTEVGDSQTPLEGVELILTGYNIVEEGMTATTKIENGKAVAAFPDICVNENGNYQLKAKKKNYISVEKDVTVDICAQTEQPSDSVEVTMQMQNFAFAFEKTSDSIAWSQKEYENKISAGDGVKEPKYAIVAWTDNNQVSATEDTLAKYAVIDENTGKITVKDLTQAEGIALPVTLTIQAKNGTDTEETAEYQLTIDKAEKDLSWKTPTGIVVEQDKNILNYGVEAQVSVSADEGDIITYSISEGAEYVQIAADGSLSYSSKEVPESGEIPVTIQAVRAESDLYQQAAIEYSFTLKRNIVTEVFVTGAWCAADSSKEPEKKVVSYQHENGTWSTKESGWFGGETLAIAGPEGSTIATSLGQDTEWQEQLTLDRENEFPEKIYVKGRDGSISQEVPLGNIPWDKNKPVDLSITYHPVQGAISTFLESINDHYYKDKDEILYKEKHVTISAKDAESGIKEFKLGFVSRGAAEQEEPAKYTTIKKEEMVKTDNTYSYSFWVTNTELKHIAFIAVDNAGNEAKEKDSKNAVIFDNVEPKITSDMQPGKLEYFNGAKTTTISIEDVTFDPSGVEVSVTDWEGNELPEATPVKVGSQETTLAKLSESVKNAKWNSSGTNTHKLELTWTEDGFYKLNVSATDLAGNSSAACYQFCIDTKEPGKPEISYEKGVINDTTEGNVTTKYYNKEFSVTFQLADNDKGSGIGSLKWKCIGKNGKETELKDAGEIKNGSVTVTIREDEVKNCGEHMYVAATVYDKAGNSFSYEDKATELVLDKNKPIIKVTYDNNAAENGSFYQKERKATICVEDTHFTSENVSLKVEAKDKDGNPCNTAERMVELNGKQISLENLEAEVKKKDAWIQTGKKHSIEVTYRADAYYTISLVASDLVKNSAEKVDKFVIDKTAPVQLGINYGTCKGEQAAGGILKKYYQDTVNVTLYGTEKETKIQKVYYKATGDTKYQEMKNFTVSGNTVKGNITVNREGANEVIFKLIDMAGNTTEYRDNIQIVIDKDTPKAAVTYVENTDKETPINGSFYPAERTATITVTDKNFSAQKVTVAVTAKDIEGNQLSDAAVRLGEEIVSISQLAEKAREAKWSKNGDSYSLKITYMQDGYYSAAVSARDWAERKTNQVKHVFCIDKTRPSGLNIKYSTPVFEEILEKITFGYFKGSTEIVLEATDITSGIQTFDWKYLRAEGASESNLKLEQGTVEADKITYSKDKRTAKVKIRLTAKKSAQYRGNMSFTVTDNTGNRKSYKDSGEEIIVDNISPTMKVSYQPINENEKKAYFNKAAVVHFEVTEANFKAADVKIKVNGKDVVCRNWKNVKGTDIWNGSIHLKENGDYKVSVTYKDRSSNKMKSYTSKTLVVDKKKPVIKVSYDNNTPIITENVREFYDKKRVAVITVTDKNFRPNDVEVDVTAVGVDGAAINVMDYKKYLKQSSSWKKDGDKYTAEIRFTEDANYTFDISYTDMAKNTASDYKKDEFTVDTKAPLALQVSYSQSVLETILENITFGFYDAKVTVTMTAQDEVSGVNEFVYSYKKSEAVSDVNSELLNQRLEAAELVYSDGNKTATATFEIPKAELDANHQFHGTIEFSAADKSKNESRAVEEQRIVVDNIAPVAEVTYNNPTSSAEGIDYYAEAIEGQITITEANFYAEDVEVTATKDGAPYNLPITWSDASADVHNGTFQISEDGDYLITMNYQDKSGNTMAVYESNQLTVDSTTPSITVEDIADGTAYNQETIGLKVYVDDVNFDVSSFQPMLTAVVRDANGNFSVKDYSELGNITAVENGKSYVYVVENIPEDAIYTLSCAVADLSLNEMSEMTVAESGNAAVESVTFSVNRNGSTFMLDTATQEVVDNYYVQMVEENVVLKEVNCDPITERQLTVNGELLQENKDYHISDNRGENTWYQYDYSIDKKRFEEEGSYAVVVASKDKAQNMAYSDMKNVEASFVVDRTAPVVTVSGLAEDGRYQVETQKVNIIPKDDGGMLQSLEVNIYDKEDKLIETAVALKGEALAENLETNGGRILFEIPQGVSQKITIACTDAAGNVTPLENTTYNNVTVSTEWYIMFLANKPLLYGTIAGVAAVVLAVGFGIGFLRRKKSKIK